ncbi:hypothetical protein ACLOJK_010371 [Asimina triloba]
MAAATGHIPFLIFLLFLTSSSLRTQARLPNIFHKTTHFNVATEDSIPKEEEEEEKQHPVTSTSASQNPNRDGRLYGYSDPEKYYNADAYELYDQDPLKSSPIVTNYNTKEEEEEDDRDFQLYHDQAIAEKKPLPFTSTSSNHENYYGTGSSSGSSYQAKETYDNRDKQYYYGLENGRYYYDDDINADAVNGGSRGRGYAASSTSTAQYNYNSNENEMYQQQQQGEPRDGFTP